MISKVERQEPPKGNICETRAKERETQQRPESSDKQVRRIAVSVENAMRGKGGQGQRRPYNRRDEPVTLVSLNPKQEQTSTDIVRGHAEVGRESQKRDWELQTNSPLIWMRTTMKTLARQKTKALRNLQAVESFDSPSETRLCWRRDMSSDLQKSHQAPLTM